MPVRALDIGILTDEVSRDLAEAFEICGTWGITRFELREGSTARFPGFTAAEVGLVEERVAAGNRVTAVSPGILKGHVEHEAQWRLELDETLPRALELGARFGCPLLIVFGFERAEGESPRLRTNVMRVFERVAREAEAAGMTVAVENEPNFWVDRALETTEMLRQIGHPGLKANWDPANSHWGGYVPEHADFEALLPYIANVHVKDHLPADENAPWRPVGSGDTPWNDYLRWIIHETALEHVTLETHCRPLEESSRRSVEWLRDAIAGIEEEA